MTFPTAPPLIDAHHHLWDLDQRPQPWLDDPSVASIRRTFTLGDLRTTATQPIAGRRLHGTVAVQCIPDVPETEDLLALAEREPLIGAVVGWADLTSPAIGEVLDRLLAGPGGAYLRSLRHLVQGETDPEWLQRADVPSIADGELADWESRLRLLAAHPQVVCKVSGLITEADHEKWTVDDIRPVWDVLLSAFGPDRLMFGSDWPVANLAGGWNRWAATVDELLADCADTEIDSLLAGTATAFYRLPRKAAELGTSARTPRT
ncbi:amidohydrolase [Streptomyces sp. LUP30]|uniref:amidohydrolase family protein n=1 Tax=Streptomyces sp. LUP30 TaxID=1890285 RepID=UPI000851C146|nr:amidohydrolase family protein [Streptomyces sp. LUP30]